MKSVLVVDDDIRLNKTITGVLRDNGYDASSAENAKLALDLISKSRMDIMIIDIFLPGMNGIELLKKAKQESPDSVFIMITGLPRTDTAPEIVKEGVFDYIYKPITRKQLLNSLDSASKLLEAKASRKLTEQKSEEYKRNLEHNLHKSQQYNNNLIKNSKDLIIIINPAKQLLFINPWGAKQLNIEDLTLILGSNIWTSLWSNDSTSDAEAGFSKALNGESAFFKGFMKIDPYQMKRMWDISLTPILDESGNVEQVLIVARDQ